MTKYEGKEVIMSGWKVAGIIEAIEKGSTQLESLDPFSDFYPLLTQTTNDETSLANLDEDEREVLPIRTQKMMKKVTTTILTYPRITIETSFTYL